MAEILSLPAGWKTLMADADVSSLDMAYKWETTSIWKTVSTWAFSVEFLEFLGSVSLSSWRLQNRTSVLSTCCFVCTMIEQSCVLDVVHCTTFHRHLAHQAGPLCALKRNLHDRHSHLNMDIWCFWWNGLLVWGCCTFTVFTFGPVELGKCTRIRGHPKEGEEGSTTQKERVKSSTTKRRRSQAAPPKGRGKQPIQEEEGGRQYHPKGGGKKQHHPKKEEASQHHPEVSKNCSTTRKEQEGHYINWT